MRERRRFRQREVLYAVSSSFSSSASPSSSPRLQGNGLGIMFLEHLLYLPESVEWHCGMAARLLQLVLAHERDRATHNL